MKISTLTDGGAPQNGDAAVVARSGANVKIDLYQMALKTTVAALLAEKQDTSERNAANGYAGLGSDGKVAAAQLPAFSVTNVFVVDSEAEMLALSAIVGDIAIRSDENKTYILATTGASTFANWQELLSPTGAVTSVAGRTGAVLLSTIDISGITSFARTLLDDSTSTAARATLELGSAALYDVSYFALASHSHTFASLTSKPTTVAGYGITNAYTKAEVDALVGSGGGGAGAAQAIGDVLFTLRAPGSKYLAADGAEYSETSYPDLAALLGVVEGSGVGDLATWTAQLAVQGSAVYSITYGANKFVAVGAEGRIGISADGLGAWSVTQPIGTSTLWSVHAANNIFVVVGGSGRIHTSLDAVDWTLRTNPFAGTDTINTVFYGNGIWVAGGSAGKTAYSTDNGVTWTQGGTVDANVISIKYFEDRFVLVTTESVYTSVDGISWTLQKYRPYGTSVNMKDIDFDGTNYWVCATNTNKLRQSTDLITWTENAYTPSAGTYIVKILYRAGVIILVGDAGLVATSTDGGANWNEPVDGVGSAVAWALAYSGERFIVGTTNGDFTTAEWLSSGNVFTTTAIPDAGPAKAYYRAVA